MSYDLKGADFRINEQQKQFELEVKDHIAFLEYFIEGEKIFLTHTEAPKELRDTGAAAELVKRTLEYCKTNNFIVVPSCSYVAKYIDKNPQWRSILSDGYQM